MGSATLQVSKRSETTDTAKNWLVLRGHPKSLFIYYGGASAEYFVNQFSQEVIENDICAIGDKCEACHDEGFNNDGINIPLVLSLVEKGKL